MITISALICVQCHLKVLVFVVDVAYTKKPSRNKENINNLFEVYVLLIYTCIASCRVHFGMNGSMRINPAAERKDQRGSLPVLVVQLTNDCICFYDSTVEIR